MFTINTKNVELVRKLCGIEMACRIMPDIAIDLSHSLVKELISRDEISKETALASTDMGPSELGEVESLSLLERFASLSNPHYAQTWFKKRRDWGRLLYSTPENPEILRRVLPNLPRETLTSMEFSTARYLASKVPYIDLVAHSNVPEEEDIPQPELYVTDPALSMWRHLISKELLNTLHEKTQWDIFNPQSNDCIYVNTSEEETRLMMLSRTKPLPVIISRGRWTRNNIDDIIRQIEMSEHPESMMLILFERVCRLWGHDSELAKEVKAKLRYIKILTPEGLLKYYTVGWFPSVPAIHHYVLGATELELERLVDSNYRAGIGIYDAVGVMSPTALRRICVASLRWMLAHKADQAQSIRNILNIIAHYTHKVPWKRDDAQVCQDALSYTYTKELKLQFVLMASYPHDYKEALAKD